MSKPGKLTRNLAGHSQVRTIAVSPDGKMLASAEIVQNSKDGVIVWNMNSGQPQCMMSTEASGKVSALAFSPDSKLMAISSFVLNVDQGPDAVESSISQVYPATGLLNWRKTIFRERRCPWHSMTAPS